ncbi:MAG TPA: GGDEF domain-containing protein [Geobacteraceae bacterium]|nr:GGDEF domain-containing protein [Geobacteraceae bacterium]
MRMFMDGGCDTCYENSGYAVSLPWFGEARQERESLMQKKMAGLAFLASFARGVGASLDPREVVLAAAKQLQNFFHYDLAVFTLPADCGGCTAFSPLRKTAQAKALLMTGGVSPELKSWEMKDGRLPAGAVFRGGKGFINKQSAVEISGDGFMISLFCAADDSAEATPELLTALAENLTAALGNAREHEKVKELSLRDALTGLYNRRVLEEILSVEESRRNPAPLAVLLIDVDDFKAINDNFGHPAGDRVLTVLGRLLQENCRRENIVARYGGEEFAVLMTNAGLTATAALQTAERLRKVLGAQDFAFSGRKIKLTVSIGVAFSTGKMAVEEKMLEMADRALYRSKRSGKNRVSFNEAVPADGMSGKGCGVVDNRAASRCG